MPIPPIEAQLAKEKIDNAILINALIELAVTFRRRDKHGFDILYLRLREYVGQIDFHRLIRTLSAELQPRDQAILYEGAARDAVALIDGAMKRARQRFCSAG